MSIRRFKLKNKEWDLVKCIAIPLFVGGLSAFLSGGGMEAFALLKKPPFSPPGWIFPVVWTILYILMGIASWLIWDSGAEKQNVFYALMVYGRQLFVNFFWPVFFFKLEWYLFAFVWLALLWGLILVNILVFYCIRKTAAYLLILYLVWVTFAGYLNLGIWYLN